jgi:hypothetical protein
VPLNPRNTVTIPEVPESPKCYAKAHLERIDTFRNEIELDINPRKLENQPPATRREGWRHELDHDVESVFWLLLYWAMVAQPAKGHIGSHIDSSSWSSLLGDFKDRNRLVVGLSSGDPPDNLTHPAYNPLWPLIRGLAAILVVDRHWPPESSARKHPDYICEAFQRLILKFIDSNRCENFMTCRVSDSLRPVQEVAQSHALSTTPSQWTDGSERETEAKRSHLDRTDVGCVYAIFGFLSFLLLCLQDEDEEESSRMIQ